MSLLTTMLNIVETTLLENYDQENMHRTLQDIYRTQFIVGASLSVEQLDRLAQCTYLFCIPPPSSIESLTERNEAREEIWREAWKLIRSKVPALASPDPERMVVKFEYFNQLVMRETQQRLAMEEQAQVMQ
jgi:hypothetical protein